jgi:glycosyltransferase involved in cell wall biosynthesis
MRIACISTSTVPSRAANSIQLFKAASALLSLGHQVQLWLPEGSRQSLSASLSDLYGVRQVPEIERLPWQPRLKRYDFSLRALRRAHAWKPDLLYVWPLQVAAFASLANWPVLLELHDRPHGRMGPMLLRAFLAGRGARRLLITTGALRDWLEVRYRKRLRPPFAPLAPNGVDLERYRQLPSAPEARQRLGWAEGFTLVYTGHLYPGRGLDLMLDLARRNPDLHFVWVGGEPEAVAAWRRRVAAEGLDNLHLLGFVPNAQLPLIQAAADALLMPYERHIEVSGGGDTAAFASPMKVFEYLAAGRPILSSDLPVLREILEEEDAILLPPEAPDPWHQAVRELVAKPAWAAWLGQRARQRAEGYTWLSRARMALDGVKESRL